MIQRARHGDTNRAAACHEAGFSGAEAAPEVILPVRVDHRGHWLSDHYWLVGGLVALIHRRSGYGGFLIHDD